MKKLLLIKPRGFCAGVERAIEIVERALVKYGAPIYVKHEIVHNKKVVDDLKGKGVIFIEDLSEVPYGSMVIFSAHGVSKSVENDASQYGLKTIDATCPLVKKVHRQATFYEKTNREIILIGHTGHPEVIGTTGRVDKPMHLVQTVEDVSNLQINAEAPVSYITQTTLSLDDTRQIVDALKAKFKDITGPELSDICYATQNRQTAVKKACATIDLLLVVGSKNSSNSNRLRDVGESNGVRSYLINDSSEIDGSWFKDNIRTIGITAGASAPEELIHQVINYLKSVLEIDSIEESDFGIAENIKFNIPKELLGSTA